jgi:UDP-glucose 4-epimerase
MRKQGARGIVFASTGSIYGDAPVIPTPENCPFPIQNSLYAASKLACEGLLGAYAEGYGFKSRIFRFVSILGPRYSHGHVLDFVRQLKADPKKLKILGNGQQKKSYLAVQDCVEAILTALKHQPENKIDIYNLGTDEYVTVDQSIEVIVKELKVEPKKEYTGGERGWIGDIPFIFLDAKKIRSIGWAPKKSIRESVRETVKYLVENMKS